LGLPKRDELPAASIMRATEDKDENIFYQLKGFAVSNFSIDLKSLELRVIKVSL
jgi:hypothetical protein